MANDRFAYLDVEYDDKEWGNIIDPTEWNANFIKIEQVFNALVTELNSGIMTDEDKQVFTAVFGETTAYDLSEAYRLGKVMAVIYNDKTHLLMSKEGEYYYFYNITYLPNTHIASMSVITFDGTEWTQSDYDFPSVLYLEGTYATKEYVDNAIDNMPPQLTMHVDGQRLIFVEG